MRWPDGSPGRTFSTGKLKCNKQINKIRYLIERTIANFLTWRILHVDYRRPLVSFAEAISAVIVPEFIELPVKNSP